MNAGTTAADDEVEGAPDPQRLDTGSDTGEVAPENAGDGVATTALTTVLSVLKSAGVRVLVLPLSAVLGVVSTRLIIENFGRATYAQYGLLVGIGAMLPFADLGMSAAVMNAVGASDRPSRDDHVRRTIITSVRVLICSALVILAIDLVITVSGAWPVLMGSSLIEGSGPLAAAGVLAVVGITLPVAFGQQVLTGIGKNHITIAIVGMQTPVMVICILAIVRFGWGDGAYLPILPYLVALAISIFATTWAARLISPTISSALRDVPRVRSVRGSKVLDVAWPSMIQMIALPIAMQTDRLVLSHVATTGDLARYNLSSQMYLPVWQVATAAGVALWPIFARARSKGDRNRLSPMPLAAGFGGAAAAVCVGISLVSPWLARVASDGEILVPRDMMIAFSLFMICQAAKYPLGMFMTDAPGLRYQAFMVVLMVPVNLGLSIVLARHLGAVGPVIGSAVGVFVFQVVANWAYVRHVLRSTPATPRKPAAAAT